VYKKQEEEQLEQQEQQHAENPFLDPPFARIKMKILALGFSWRGLLLQEQLQFRRPFFSSSFLPSAIIDINHDGRRHYSPFPLHCVRSATLNESRRSSLSFSLSFFFLSFCEFSGAGGSCLDRSTLVAAWFMRKTKYKHLRSYGMGLRTTFPPK
jgi:hypothetical protein